MLSLIPVNHVKIHQNIRHVKSHFEVILKNFLYKVPKPF